MASTLQCMKNEIKVFTRHKKTLDTIKRLFQMDGTPQMKVQGTVVDLQLLRLLPLHFDHVLLNSYKLHLAKCLENGVMTQFPTL